MRSGLLGACRQDEMSPAIGAIDYAVRHGQVNARMAKVIVAPVAEQFRRGNSDSFRWFHGHSYLDPATIHG
jgi:hypothetical protein